MTKADYLNSVLDMTEAACSNVVAGPHAQLQYGVLIRITSQGRAYATMDDACAPTKEAALNAAYASDRNDLLGLFSVNMASGAVVQIMSMDELVDYCEQRERSELSDEEREFNHKAVLAEARRDW